MKVDLDPVYNVLEALHLSLSQIYVTSSLLAHAPNFHNVLEKLLSVCLSTDLDISSFDYETIWEQIQYYNRPFYRQSKKALTSLNSQNEDAIRELSSDDGVDPIGPIRTDYTAVIDTSEVEEEHYEDYIEEEFRRDVKVDESSPDKEDESDKMDITLDEMDALEDFSENDEMVLIQKVMYGDIDDNNEQAMYSDFFINEKSAGSKGEAAAMTRYQKQKLLSQGVVAQLESEAVGNKSWEFKGEVKSSERPENSLLELAADIDRTSKPNPVITQEHSKTLEEKILLRIRENNFDDVMPPLIRRDKDTPTEIGEKLLEERSREGLGEIYAGEFLRKSIGTLATSKSQASEAKLRELTSLFSVVCQQLDSLSHFYFSPRPISLEAALSTVDVLPSLAMEEIGPTASSVSTALTAAPEEIYEKKTGRDIVPVASQELSREQKASNRRAKKVLKKRQRKNEEERKSIERKENPHSASAKASQAAADEAFIRADKRVKIR